MRTRSGRSAPSPSGRPVLLTSPDISAALHPGALEPQRALARPPRAFDASAPAWLDHGAVPALDGMRAVSVLLVMAAHSGLQNVIPGGFGVTMFFFISGFLITTLMLRETREEGRVDIGAFYRRRILRLYPPLLVYLAAVVGFRWAFLSESVDPIGLIGAVFYGGNYLVALAPAHIAALGSHLWSLAVEEHFYLLYPLLFPALARSSRPLALLAACCALVLGARVAYVLAGVPASYVIVATETRFDSILYGVFLAFVAASPDARARLSALARPAMLWAGVALLLATLAIRDPLFRETARYSLQGVALLAIFAALLFSPERSFVRRALDSRAARWVGALSYALYLWHGAMFEAAHYALDGRVPAFVTIIVGWFAAFGVAVLVYLLIETPLFALRRRFGSQVRAPG